MTVDAIMALTSAQAVAGRVPVDPFGGAMAAASMDPGSAVGNFGQLISQGIGAVNQELLAAQTDLQQLATGDAQNLHQIMIRMEESRLSFQLLLQVRNRLLEAYQDVMKMQV